MTEALLALPAHLRRRLARALETGRLEAPVTVGAVRSELGVRRGADGLVEALTAWEALGVPDRAKAAWLRSLEEAASRRAAPELVWSGPKVPGAYVGETRGVVENALRGATQSVWLSTYVFFDGQRAFELLARRMEDVPGLEVTLLLNIERRRTDTTAEEALVRRFAERLWEKEWPGARRPRVFYDPRSVEESGPEGVLHAKALVVDKAQVLVTSANLTERALDRNIEIGVLLRDPGLARTVVAHFQRLISHGHLHPLPPG